MDPAETVFRVMGSEARVVVVGGPDGLLDVARSRLEELEARWSRFRADSEVSALNRADGSPMLVSEDTLVLLETALAAWETSGGLVDASVLGAVMAAGYTHSLETGRPAPPFPASNLPAPGLGGAIIDPTTGLVTLERGVGFDPGGIGKGLAADLTVSALLEAGARGACVAVGGDLAMAGDGPDDGGWGVGVEDPHRPDLLLCGLRLSSAGVATSSTRSRPLPGGHHLIDPRKGVPVSAGVAAATVVAGRAWVAETLAKAVVVGGWLEGVRIVEETGAAALAVRDDGEVLTSPHWEVFSCPIR